jgi:hypothetical protein
LFPPKLAYYESPLVVFGWEVNTLGKANRMGNKATTYFWIVVADRDLYITHAGLHESQTWITE